LRDAKARDPKEKHNQQDGQKEDRFPSEGGKMTKEMRLRRLRTPRGQELMGKKKSASVEKPCAKGKVAKGNCQVGRGPRSAQSHYQESKDKTVLCSKPTGSLDEDILIYGVFLKGRGYRP